MLALMVATHSRAQPEPAPGFTFHLSLKDWMIVQRALMEMREHEPAANDVFIRLREQMK
jgi:hypothetical protein